MEVLQVRIIELIRSCKSSSFSIERFQRLYCFSHESIS
uniref:Uncharacterized protein n=1 Tax=viral metagenome TaxID=1070528 RepID=A0A6C0IZ67_9ZZZZ